MDRTVEIVDIEIKDCGRYFLATSRDLPEICVAHQDIKAIYGDIPNVLRAIYQQRHGVDVLVLPVSRSREGNGSAPSTPWAVIPPEVAAKNSRDAR